MMAGSTFDHYMQIGHESIRHTSLLWCLMPGYIMMYLLRWVAGCRAEPGDQWGWVEGPCGCLGNHSPSDLLDCKGDGHMD